MTTDAKDIEEVANDPFLDTSATAQPPITTAPRGTVSGAGSKNRTDSGVPSAAASVCAFMTSPSK